MSLQLPVRKWVALLSTIALIVTSQRMVSISSAEEKPADGAPSDAPRAPTQSTETVPATTVTEPPAETSLAVPSEPVETQPADQPASQDTPTAAGASAPATPLSPPRTQYPAPTGVAALPPLPAAEPLLPTAPVGQKRAGFALELFFGAVKPLIALDDDFLDFNSINGGLFLGGKINRVIVGLGVEMSRMRYHTEYGSNYYYDRSEYDNEDTSSITELMFKPGVRFVMVQSEDQKVDMFGQVDVGAGTIIRNNDDNDLEEEETKYFLLDWDGALGVRYWAHPQFAVSATGGIQGNFFREKEEDTGTVHAHHVMSIAGALQLLGVF